MRLNSKRKGRKKGTNINYAASPGSVQQLSLENIAFVLALIGFIV